MAIRLKQQLLNNHTFDQSVLNGRLNFEFTSDPLLPNILFISRTHFTSGCHINQCLAVLEQQELTAFLIADEFFSEHQGFFRILQAAASKLL
jgi:hypothetical protein